MPGASEFLKKKPVIAGPTPPPETPVDETQQQDSFDFSRYITDPRDGLIETSRDNYAFLTSSRIIPGDTNFPITDSRGPKAVGGLDLGFTNRNLYEPYTNPATGLEEPGTRYQPTTEELNTLDAYGLLFDPANENMPLYPLTDEFKRQGRNPLLGAAGLGLEIGFGAFEEGIKQGRLQSEKALRYTRGNEIFGGRAFGHELGWTDKEAETYKYYMDQFREENGREPDLYEERLIFDKSFHAPGINLPFSQIPIPFTEYELPDYDFTGRSAFTLVGELYVPMKYVDDIAGAVLKVGFDGIKSIKGTVFPSSTASDTPGIAPDTITVINKPKDNVFDMPDIKTSQTKQEIARTVIIDNSSTKSIKNTVTNLFRIIHERGITRGESLGATISSTTDQQMKNVFEVDGGFDEFGGIVSLPKDEFGFHPTIADAAADLARYSNGMSQEQLSAFLKLRDRLAAIERSQVEAGVKIELNSRHDIKEGGFYVPRGSTFDETAEAASTGGGRNKGGSSYLKDATQETQAAGMREGIVYKSFRDAMNDHVKEVGRKTSKSWAARALNNIKDADGKPISTSLEARLSQFNVIEQGRILKDRINTLRLQINSQTVRAKERTKVSKKADRKKSQTEESADRELDRLAKNQKATLEDANIKVVEAAFRRLEAEDAIKGGRDSTPEGREFRALVREAKLTINRSIGEGQRLVRLATLNTRRAQDIKSVEKKLIRQVIKIADELDQIVKETTFLEESVNENWFLNKSQAELNDMWGLYRRLIKADEKLNKKIDEADFKFEVLEERLEETDVMKELLDEASAVEVEKRHQANEILRKNALAERQLERLKATQRMRELEQKTIIKQQKKLSNRDLNRITRQITEAGGEADNLETEAIEAWIRVQELVDEQDALRMEYEDIANEIASARRQAAGPGKNKLFIDLPELRGTSFPERLASGINKVMEKEISVFGKGANVIRAYLSYNRLFRQLTATGDDSALWIHGVLRMADDPKGATQDFLWHLKAYQADGDKILGAYINDFDQKALNNKRLTSDLWAQYGLRVGGVDTEYQLGVGSTKFIQAVPGVRNVANLSNRLFGFLGDRMRLEMANGELDRLLLEGRTIDEIRNSDLIYQITDAINSATGYSSTKYGGDIADMVTYAPRFFQARIENLYRATIGIAKDPIGAVSEAVPGKRMFAGETRAVASPLKVSEKERVARRAMLRLLSGAVAITYAANSTRGYETDFNIFSKDNKGNWNYNSNFLRIQNVLGQDISLLGPYDSLLRLMITTGSGTYHLGRGGNPLDGLKGIAAGPISQINTLFLTNEQFDGTPIEGKFIPGTRLPEQPDALDRALAKGGWYIESFLPFASEGFTRFGEFMDKGETANAFGSLPLSYYAVKSSPSSYTDTMRLVAMEFIREGTESPTATEDGPKWGFQNYTPLNPFDESFKLENLSKGERDILSQDPRVQAALEKLSAKVPDDLSRAFSELEQIFIANEQDLLVSIEGDAYPNIIAGQIQELKKKNAQSYEDFEVVNKELLEEKEKIEETRFEVRADYWGNRLSEVEISIDVQTGFIDYEKFEKDREFVISLAAEEDERFRTYLEGTGPGTYSGERYENEQVRQAVEEYETFLEEMARPYFDIDMRVAKMINQEEIYRKYLESPNKSQFKSPLIGDNKQPLIDIIKNLANDQRTLLLAKDPLLEANLYMYGLTSGIPKSSLVNKMMIELKKESGSDQIDTRRIKDYIEQGFFEGPQYD
jgi:hypothetical protein